MSISPELSSSWGRFTSKARSAVPAKLVEPPHAYAIADFEVGHFIYGRAKLCNDSNSLMAEALVRVEKVFVGAADTAV